jgi:hypothetical protein
MNGRLLESIEELNMNDNPYPVPLSRAVPNSDKSKAASQPNQLKTLVRALARHAAASDHAALVKGVMHGANDNTVAGL